MIGDPTVISDRTADLIGLGLIGTLVAGLSRFAYRVWRQKRERRKEDRHND